MRRDGYALIAEPGDVERDHLAQASYTWPLAEGLCSQGMSYQAQHPVLDTVDHERATALLL